MSLEVRVLALVAEQGECESMQMAATLDVPHQTLVGTLKSLSAAEMVVLTQQEEMRWSVAPEGLQAAETGSPEAKVWECLPETLAALEEKLGKDIATVGVKQLAKKVKFNKEGKTVTIVKQDETEKLEDVCQQQLKSILGCKSLVEAEVAAAVDKAVLEGLKKRKLISLGKVTFYKFGKGPKFALQRKKELTDLTKEMLADGSWATETFKAYNYNALGKPSEGGHMHPLLRLRQEYREIFLELGFQEMETDCWVESSFWCFDTLFVPQQHPARDAQDTFFIKDPATTDKHPPEYLEKIRKVHSEGDYGSVGYQCEFSVPITSTNVLRTHTTACSARTLQKLATTGFKPGKYFSIDRVFRNEEMDKTHLCEFHQIEGFVVDYNLSLANMMHVLEQFFKKIGVKKLRFKPAYNPYTEPSMEVFGYHEGLEKWIEVGNSGVFRPEMLRPMGFDENVTAIAWGLSLERPAMMMYDFNNIHKLVGHDVDLSFIREAPIQRVSL